MTNPNIPPEIADSPAKWKSDDRDPPRPEAQEQEDQAMTKLTKAERERIACMYGDVYVHRLLADLDAAAAAAAGARRRRTGSGRSASAVVRTCEDRDDMMAQRDRAESELDEIKTALGVMGATRERALEVAGSQDALEERIDSMSRERDVALKGWSAAEAARDAAAAQRDRAESELDAERRMRVEAEAASDRMAAERDALKAKLADPRRVVIHETEVVATKDEITSLKTRLADLSEADEELHACRALVNATSENLIVDLERMVDDLAEANEKAARSEKDSHSWHDLYEDTKAKLAAAESAHSELFLSGQVAELRGKLAALVADVEFSVDYVDHKMLCQIHESKACTCGVLSLRAAIAAARGGAS